MRIAGIVRDSIVDGSGVRDVVFFQGCPHHCKGCHNPQTWNFDAGTEMTVGEIVESLSTSSNNVTISGGEPLMQHEDVIELVYQLGKQGKTCWLYTGFSYESFNWRMWWQLCVSGLTVVVDGDFKQDKKDSTLLFRGSSNQRIIDLEKTLRSNEVVLWEEV
jgi:anaerobic ribonucleoside-triphosphate reductase activating protein